MKTKKFDIELDKELEEELLYEALLEEFDDEDDEEFEIHKKRKGVLSNVNMRTLVILFLTLVINTYAWFLYVNTVQTKMDVHIKSWDFDLQDEGGESEMVFVCEEIYPGFETATKTVRARNNGETDAKVSLTIISARILDDVYAPNEEDATDAAHVMSSDDIFDMLINDYPFKIDFLIDGERYDPEEPVYMSTGESAVVTMMVSWDYQTGTTDEEKEINDEIDTLWGNKAYDYYNDKLNTTDDEEIQKYCIEIHVNVKAEQSHTDTGNTVGNVVGP